MAGMAGPQLFLQFVTRYLHWSGELRCRVTTVTRRWVDGGNVAELIQGGVLGGAGGVAGARQGGYHGVDEGLGREATSCNARVKQSITNSDLVDS